MHAQGNGGARWERSPVVSAAAVAALAGVAYLVCGDTSDFVNFDSLWALLWGDDLASADLSSYGGGPTPHPLTIALGALLSPLGRESAAFAVACLLGYLSLGLLTVMTYRLTRALSTTLAAVVAAVLVFVNAPILATGAASFLDIPFVALVVTALALEVERPGRRVAPLVALALAGLLRPEAWGLAGLYWLYTAWQSREVRPWTLALVAAPPLIWLGMDAVVEGNPAYSLTHTEALADELYGQFSIFENLRHGFDDLREYLPTAALAGALLGTAILVWRKGRQAIVPVAVLVIMGGFFVFLAVAGLPTNARYLLVPVVLLCVGFGVGAGEWAADRASRPLLAAGAVLAVLLVVHLASEVDRVRDVEPLVAAVSKPWADLDVLYDDPAAQRAVGACPAIGVPSTQAEPYVKYAFGLGPRDVVRADETHRADLVLLPRTPDAAAVLSRARFGITPETRVPDGYEEVATATHWSLSATGGCAR